MSLRLHLDENMNPRLAQALRQHSIDVTTTVEADLLGADDDGQLEYARATNRVIVTHDVDFLRMAGRTESHPGIIFCAKEKMSLGQMIESLVMICEVLTPGEMAGRVEYM